MPTRPAARDCHVAPKRWHMTRLLSIALSFLTLAFCSTGLSAQQELPRRMTFFEGRCRMQLVADFLPCQPKTLFAELRNGRAFLTFFAGKHSWTVSGSGDRQPNLENYYHSIDTIRMLEGSKHVGEDRQMEGECHFRLNKQATKFFWIRCDVYNRGKGSHYKFYFEPIIKFEKKDF